MDNIICSHCDREISKSNYLIHDLRCKKINYRCDKCFEIIMFKDKLLHDDTHVIISCISCLTEIEKGDLEEHQLYCSDRFVECYICKDMITFKMLGEHISYCGSRTTRCDDCYKRFMLKDLENHICEDLSRSD